MIIDVYKTTDDNRTANKTLTPVLQNVSILPYNAINMNSPEFLIEYNATIFTANYLYCHEFDRYYYITNISVDTGGRMILQCKKDVLKTAYQYLQNKICTVVRSESVGTPTDIPDSQLPINPVAYETLSQIFPVSIGSEHEFVLITIGGSTTP